MGFEKLLPATLMAGTGGAAIGLVATLLFLFWILRKNNSERLPPGPYPLPIIGNLLQMKQQAYRTLKDLSDVYGPIMFLRIGSVPTVVASSTEMAKQFLKTHDLIFASRPPTSAGRYFYNFNDIALAPYGDHWRQMRKVCVLKLLTTERIKSFRHVREEEVCTMMNSIWKESESGARAVNLSNAINNVLSNIIWRILSSKRFDGDLGFKDLIQEVSVALTRLSIGDLFPYLDWYDFQGVKRSLKAASAKFDAFTEKMINDHVHHLMPTAAPGGHEETEPDVNDFLDVLLQMADGNSSTDKILRRETIKAVIFELFTGGMDTSASGLEWAMSELLRHPHAMKKLQAEIECVVGKHGEVKESDLGSMEYLHSVVKETLRLYPPLPLALPHASVEAVTVGKYYFPKKTMLMVNVWAIGRDPSVWGADASEFKPERFMHPEEHAIDLAGANTDFRMLPFGAGRRGCPGSAMAVLSIEFTLANLVHTFDWRVDGVPSELDMKESCSTSLRRQDQLFAYPCLKLPLKSLKSL